MPASSTEKSTKKRDRRFSFFTQPWRVWGERFGRDWLVEGSGGREAKKAKGDAEIPFSNLVCGRLFEATRSAGPSSFASPSDVSPSPRRLVIQRLEPFPAHLLS